LNNYLIEPVALQDFFITFFANKTGILYKLHVFGISIVLAFPFTWLIHIISAPIWYFGRRYQVVRQRHF